MWASHKMYLKITVCVCVCARTQRVFVIECVYVWLSACGFVCMWVCTCERVYVWACVSVCAHACVRATECVSDWVWMCVCESGFACARACSLPCEPSTVVVHWTACGALLLKHRRQTSWSLKVYRNKCDRFKVCINTRDIHEADLTNVNKTTSFITQTGGKIRPRNGWKKRVTWF